VCVCVMSSCFFNYYNYLDDCFYHHPSSSSFLFVPFLTFLFSHTHTHQGFANLIGDGIAMGFGEYMSEISEHQYMKQERQREEWEFDECLEVRACLCV
jgi:hypothetical protein